MEEEHFMPRHTLFILFHFSFVVVIPPYLRKVVVISVRWIVI